MAMKNQPNTNSSASVHNLTYQKGHMNSMTDALKEVRKSKETIKDNHYLRPDNHKGFYLWSVSSIFYWSAPKP